MPKLYKMDKMARNMKATLLFMSKFPAKALIHKNGKDYRTKVDICSTVTYTHTTALPVEL